MRHGFERERGRFLDGSAPIDERAGSEKRIIQRPSSEKPWLVEEKKSAGLGGGLV